MSISLTACSNRHPAYSEYDLAANMIVRPADSLLVGEYELDDFSYSRVDKTQAYPNTAILLTIRANGSFQVTNLPDIVMSTTGTTAKKQLLTAMGSWSVLVDQPSGYSIVFRFKAGDLLQAPFNLNAQLKLRIKQPAISFPIGPPGSNQQLLFVKNE